MGIIKPGDNIEVGGVSGVVQDITWRHTTIEDACGQTIIVPNSTFPRTRSCISCPLGAWLCLLPSRTRLSGLPLTCWQTSHQRNQNGRLAHLGL